GVDFMADAMADLIDEYDNVVLRPVQEFRHRDAQGHGFLCKAYLIAKKCTLRVRVVAERGIVTIGHFAKDIGLALVRKGPPNRTTCFMCSRLVALGIKG